MRKHVNILLPIKNPDAAKERLGELLTIQQRKELAEFLIEQTFQFFSAFLDIADVLVVTDSPVIAQRASERGFAALVEEQAEGETKAVERGTEWSVANGYESQIVIPGDMVALDPSELRQLLQMHRPSPVVILCPATGEDGTNAILTSPPNIIAFRFGERSFPDYCERARKAGVPCQIVRLRSLLLDLDTPEDVRSAIGSYPDSALSQKLIAWDIQRL